MPTNTREETIMETPITLSIHVSTNKKATNLVHALYTIDSKIDFIREYKENNTIVLDFDIHKSDIPYQNILNIVRYLIS